MWDNPGAEVAIAFCVREHWTLATATVKLVPAPLVFCPCWHQGVQTPSGKALPSLRAPACQLLSSQWDRPRAARTAVSPAPAAILSPAPWQGHTLGLAPCLQPPLLAGRRPTPRVQSAWRFGISIADTHARRAAKPCCQETVSPGF